MELTRLLYCEPGAEAALQVVTLERLGHARAAKPHRILKSGEEVLVLHVVIALHPGAEAHQTEVALETTEIVFPAAQSQGKTTRVVVPRGGHPPVGRPVPGPLLAEPGIDVVLLLGTAAGEQEAAPIGIVEHVPVAGPAPGIEQDLLGL